jgi:hypothetical protein
MVAESRGDDDSDKLESGLVAGHAFSLLGAYELNVMGKKVRLLKLRNPWLILLPLRIILLLFKSK